MSISIYSIDCQGPGAEIPGKVRRINNRANLLSPCEIYETILRDEDDPCVYIGYSHDDVIVHEDFDLPKVTGLLGSPSIVAVGFGGATRLGSHHLYKRPYQLADMARGDYSSNQTDWQVHGSHATEPKQVAVLDAFFMAVKKDFLKSVGGWPTKHLTHHCLDLWLACEAARAGKQIWTVPVLCTHLGGGTSTKGVYPQAKWVQADEHGDPHKWIHEEYRDVLPIVIGGSHA